MAMPLLLEAQLIGSSLGDQTADIGSEKLGKAYRKSAYPLDKSNRSIPSLSRWRSLASPITDTLHRQERENEVE